MATRCYYTDGSGDHRLAWEMRTWLRPPTRWLPKEDGDELGAEAQVQTSAAPFRFSSRLAKGTRDLDLELLGQPCLTQRYRRPRAVATLKSPS